MLEIEDLWVRIGKREIIKGVNMKIKGGVNILLGPNGSGKTTLLRVIMGDPRYEVEGRILFEGKDITDLKPYERYKLGISIMVQHPPKLPIKFRDFLELLGTSEYDICPRIMELLDRNLFENFSGGEKKRAEFLISLSGNPKLLLLDEPDSGVDVDTVKIFGKVIRKLSRKKVFLIVTHSGRIIREIGNIEKVFVMKDGEIVKRDGASLVNKILERGYEWI